MQQFVINYQNIKISTILIICLLDIHRVLSACSDDEWDCDDGSCIQLDRRCDGIVDCDDRSDETAENCIHRYRSCQEFAFTCTYGACITKSHRCNGIQDCADNSDELVCSKNRAEQLQGTCNNPEKIQCIRSKECIDSDLICDGERDCADGSDETVEICADFLCPEVGFHCGYGGCINADAKCNGTIECSDGSDEAAELCGTPRKRIDVRLGSMTTKTPTSKPTPTPKPKPKPTPTPTPTPTPKTQTSAETPDGAGCAIPSDIANVTVKLHPLNNTILPGTWVEDSETIHVECSNRAAIRGAASLFCDNGKFNSKFPSCSTYCDANLLKGLSTVYNCFRNGYYLEQRQCGTRILPNTEIEVSCAVGYRRSKGNERQKIVCLPNGTFDVKREPCKVDCGTVQPSIEDLTRKGVRVKPNKVPWHVAIYEKSDGSYSFICGGSIISPTLIISAAHCFWVNVQLPQMPVENYQFIAGKYSRGYSLTGDEMPKTMEAVSIHISENFRGKYNNNYGDVALIKLKEPLIYNDNISAVCLQLSSGGASDYIESGTYGTVTGYGQENTLEQVGMTSIDFHTCRNDATAKGLKDDKFCLNNKEDMSICRGDSGGGFVVKEGEKFYIWGIISYAPSTTNDCARDGFVSVTNVRYIQPELKQKIQSKMAEDNLLY